MPEPEVQSKALFATKITSNSIAIKWEPASTANPDPLFYRIGLSESENPLDPWHVVHEGKEIYSYTFTGLKPKTSYAIYVKAFDGPIQVAQYPMFNGSMHYTTRDVDVANGADNEAPKVLSRLIQISHVTHRGFTIQWEKAYDNVTPDEEIRYEVWLKKSNAPSGSWRKYQDRTNINRTGIPHPQQLLLVEFGICDTVVQFPS